MNELTNYANPFDLALDGATKVEVKITEAAAEHVAAWDFDQRVTAIHEAAHAVIAAALGVPVKAVDITSREGGHTEIGIGVDNLPATTIDRMILDHIVVRQAAIEAERLIFGEAITGSANDISAATTLAYERIRGGLDPNGPSVIPEGIPYWAGVTEELRTQMLHAADKTLSECRARTVKLVEAHRDGIVAFAGPLYARRRLEGEALAQLLTDVVRGSVAAD